MKRKARVKAAEGMYFAIPLEPSGFAAGLVARTSKPTGVVLAYFFGRKWGTPPTIEEVSRFTAADAVRILRVGHLGLVRGSWPVIGSLAGWNREDWPVPRFMRIDPLDGYRAVVCYSDHNMLERTSVARAPAGLTLEEDGLFGAEAAEEEMSDVLRSVSMTGSPNS